MAFWPQSASSSSSRVHLDWWHTLGGLWPRRWGFLTPQFTISTFCILLRGWGQATSISHLAQLKGWGSLLHSAPICKMESLPSHDRLRILGLQSPSPQLALISFSCLKVLGRTSNTKSALLVKTDFMPCSDLTGKHWAYQQVWCWVYSFVFVSGWRRSLLSPSFWVIFLKYHKHQILSNVFQKQIIWLCAFSLDC